MGYAGIEVDAENEQAAIEASRDGIEAQARTNIEHGHYACREIEADDA